MSASVSIPLLVYVPACAVALAMAHVLLSRRQAAGRRPVSPQASLARLILLSNAPVLAGAAVIAWHEARPPMETASMLAFGGIVYNGIAYAYFHVFNMSETARRIRILLHVLMHGMMDADSLRSDYSPRDMVAVRLDRLEQMGQVARGPDGGYRIAGGVLLSAARAIRIWRLMLRLERHPVA
jgi:hypothetical protein